VTGVRNIVFCTAPGGVANERFGVKADAGTSTMVNGGSVSTWNDQSGNNRHASSHAAANNPTYYNNSTKGNSVFMVSDLATGKSSMLAIRLPQRAVVDIGFYNVLGHQLAVPGLTGRHFMDPGSYNLSVQSRNLATGVYFLSVAINNEKRVYRVTL
jgi:hypothetical protein